MDLHVAKKSTIYVLVPLCLERWYLFSPGKSYDIRSEMFMRWKLNDSQLDLSLWSWTKNKRLGGSVGKSCASYTYCMPSRSQWSSADVPGCGWETAVSVLTTTARPIVIRSLGHGLQHLSCSAYIVDTGHQVDGMEWLYWVWAILQYNTIFV